MPSYSGNYSKYPRHTSYSVQPNPRYDSQPRQQNYRHRWIRRAIIIKLFLIFLVNLLAAILCAVYAASAHAHWKVVHAHQEQLNYPDLDLHDLKRGYIAAIGRIVWAVLLVLSALCAPIWFNFVLLLAGLAWEVPLGSIAQTNFGYLITIGTGEIYPAVGSQCTNGPLSDSQKSFYAAIGGIVSKDSMDVCKSFFREGMVLQVYLIIGITAAFLFVLLMGVIGSLSKRERGKLTVTETAFSYLMSAI